MKPLEHPSQLLEIDDREQMGSAAVGPFDRVNDVLDDLFPVGEKPVEIGPKFVKRFDPSHLQPLDGEQRDQADKRPHPKLLMAAIGVDEHVVKEAVFFVEQRVLAPPHVLHGIGDVGVMLEELRGEPLVDRVFPRQLQRDPHQVEAEHSHPTGGIRLLENGAAGERLAPVDDGDVIEAEKSPLEDVVALAVDLVDPTGEVDEQLVEAALEPIPVTTPAAVIAEAIHVVNPPHCPGVNGRIEIAELPLVGGQLAVGVLKLLEEQEPELVLGECGVDQREGDALECQVPGRKPRIFPLVGHRHHAQ